MSKRIDPVDQVIKTLTDPYILRIQTRGVEDAFREGEHEYDIAAIAAELKTWLEERRDVIASLPCDRRRAESISVSRAQDALELTKFEIPLFRKHRLPKE